MPDYLFSISFRFIFSSLNTDNTVHYIIISFDHPFNLVHLQVFPVFSVHCTPSCIFFWPTEPSNCPWYSNLFFYMMPFLVVTPHTQSATKLNNIRAFSLLLILLSKWITSASSLYIRHSEMHTVPQIWHSILSHCAFVHATVFAWNFPVLPYGEHLSIIQYSSQIVL